MTVELEVPFAWPDPPEDMEPWLQEYGKEFQEMQESQQAKLSATKDLMVDKTSVKSIAEQAQALLEGREQWRAPSTRSLGPILSR